ncbi:Tat pathway signal protein [Pseudoroseomonas rhizosphaerae]|uniref:Tat pathway signal protein n=1 Tax=Teichococcus rhizosphaerae TaxID=1335062 RepID=A0A2C7AGM5_9PROT|nr:Tat pathway signal protein [Pseudoroseomonas rhizosphaerae]PHK96645.1 Tat pathway signal protein [Pseudoroseomonas rhizosphaerae]
MPIRRMLGALGFVTAALLAAPLFPLAASPAAAQGASSVAERIGLELNRLEPRQNGNANGCRVWLVLRNPGAEPVDPLRLDLLIFGKDGVIAQRLSLDVGPLPREKTLARVFDLSTQPCDGIGAFLLNDLLACGAAETAAACLPRLALSSRVDGVSFDK